MNGKIIGNRRGVNTQHNNQYLIEILDEKYKSKKETSTLAGKTVEYKTLSNKIIKGKIASAHGNKNVVRAIFEKGLPGNSVGQTVNIK